MADSNRILVVSRYRDTVDDVTRILEAVGCIVTGTSSDEVAVDLAGSSDYDALLIGDDVPQADGRYLAQEARNRTPSIAVITYRALESVLTQLQQAGIKI